MANKKYESIGDFKIYYDTLNKRNYWVLGYFGGGSVNISKAYELAKEYAEENNVPLDTVCIDEILHSRRYEHFKYIYSQNEQKPDKRAYQTENVYAWLTD